MYCRRCGTPLHTGIMICPECGARQRRQATSVRCASCHSRIPVTLSICPHCGRDVRPAGPRWGIWLVIAIGLVVMVLWGLGKLPVEQIGQEITGVKAKVAGLVQVLGPAPTAEPTEARPQTIARATDIVAPTVAAPEDQIEVTPETELTEGEEGAAETPAEPSASIAVTSTLEALTPARSRSQPQSPLNRRCCRPQPPRRPPPPYRRQQPRCRRRPPSPRPRRRRQRAAGPTPIA